MIIKPSLSDFLAFSYVVTFINLLTLFAAGDLLHPLKKESLWSLRGRLLVQLQVPSIFYPHCINDQHCVQQREKLDRFLTHTYNSRTNLRPSVTLRFIHPKDSQLQF
jgi:hypothetical protein